jgi:molecular chaperone GrpE (heat shock protein)
MDSDHEPGEQLQRLEYLRKHLLETIPNSYGRVKADLERVLKTVEEEIQQLRSKK